MPEAAPEAGRADRPARRRSRSARTRKRPSRAARSSGSSHSRPGGYEGASSARRSVGALGAAGAWKRGEPAAREERPRDVQRPAHRLAPAHRDDLAPGRERVQPLGRRRHPAPTTATRVGVLVRLVGVDGARVARELVGNASPGWPGATQHVAEDVPCPSSSKPPSTARTRVDARRHEALVPAACARAAPRRARGTRRPSGGSGRRRVCDERPERARRRAVAHREPGKRASAGSGRRSRSASAAGGSPPRARARRAAGSASVPKTAISSGSSPPWRSVAYATKPARPAADDRAALASRRSLHRAGEQPLDEVALEGEEDARAGSPAR